MNEQFTIQDVETLSRHQGKPCVSIYLRTLRIPTRVQAESLQFKNLLREAEEKLAHFDLRTPDILAILEPARALITQPDFWRYQLDGLAVFLAEGVFLPYQVPLNFETELLVGESFHLKPLIPILTNDHIFYILGVSQNRVRLLRCTRFSAQELDPANLPASLQEILDEYDIEKQIQFHTSTAAPGTGRRDAIFHGQGAGATDDEKTKIREYFGRINRGLTEYLSEQSAPLIFAGVEYLFPIYKEANTYPNLVESSITGNNDNASVTQLHREGWRLLEPSLVAQYNADIEQYHNSVAQGLTATKIEELVPWADQGRVQTLFVDKRASVWGVYDSEKFAATVQECNTPHNRDLTDMAALYTLLRGGRVHLLTSEQMAMEFGPDNRHRSNNGTASTSETQPVVAAIYRYAI